jgi:hypothetical protein
MNKEKPKNTDEEECHEKPDVIEPVMLGLVLIVNMDNKFSEVLIGSWLTLPTCFKNVLPGNLGTGIRFGKNIMGAMAVGTLCHSGEAQVGNFPVVAMAIGLKKGAMAAAALFYCVECPFGRLDRPDLMGRVATGAIRCTLVSFSQLLSVDTLFKCCLNTCMTLSTRGRDISWVDS